MFGSKNTTKGGYIMLKKNWKFSLILLGFGILGGLYLVSAFPKPIHIDNLTIPADSRWDFDSDSTRSAKLGNKKLQPLPGIRFVSANAVVHQALLLMLEDYLERFGPERGRSSSIYDNDDSTTVFVAPRNYELLGDDGEWKHVSKKEYMDWLGTERAKIDRRVGEMKRLLQILEETN